MITREEAKKRIEEKLHKQIPAQKAAKDEDFRVSSEKAQVIFEYVERRVDGEDPWDTGYITPRKDWWLIHEEAQWRTVVDILAEKLRSLGYSIKVLWSEDLPHYGQVLIRDPLSMSTIGV
jgi:hypothetical protein